MRNLQFAGTLCALLACLAPHAARAQLVAWDIAGKNSSSNNPLAATTLDSHFASASLTLGSGVGTNGFTSTFRGSSTNQSSLANAIANNQYVSFTLTPNTGQSFSISSLAASFSSNGTASFTVALLSSVTGFTASDALWSYPSSGLSNGSSALQTADLSGVAALLNLSAAIEFRFYAFLAPGNSSAIGLGNVTGNDLSVSGSASAIPEPSAYAALVGAGALAFAMWRRRAATTRSARRASPANAGRSLS